LILKLTGRVIACNGIVEIEWSLPNETLPSRRVGQRPSTLNDPRFLFLFHTLALGLRCRVSPTFPSDAPHRSGIPEQSFTVFRNL